MPRQKKAAVLLKSIKDGLRVTGIGSVPFAEADKACDLILESCPQIPYVPQLIKRDPRENMFLQFSENLPCLAADCDKKQVLFDDTQDREERLSRFYDYIAYNCYEYFKISPEYAKGFYCLLEKCKRMKNHFIKVQITGPVTYLLSVTKKDRQSLIFDNEFAEAITLGLAMKGLWQAQEIRKMGKTPILFIDEPFLWGLGSAYMPVSTEKVFSLLDNLISFIKERDNDLLLGLHCCGNTDWRMIFKSGADIISFDAYSFGDKLVLYPQEIKQFLHRGGFIAFGIVPTSEYKERITEDELRDKFISVLDGFEQKGVPGELLLSNAIFTPACGMGPLSHTDAVRVLRLTASLAKQIQDKYIEI
jgi:methionine synthase II (cobalamin-independent)